MTVFLSQFVINFYSEMPPQVRFALLSAAESERLSLNTNSKLSASFDPVFVKETGVRVVQLSAKRNDRQETSLVQTKHWSAPAKLPAHRN